MGNPFINVYVPSPQIENINDCLMAILSCTCDKFDEKGCDCCRVVMTFGALICLLIVQVGKA